MTVSSGLPTRRAFLGAAGSVLASSLRAADPAPVRVAVHATQMLPPNNGVP